MSLFVRITELSSVIDNATIGNSFELSYREIIALILNLFKPLLIARAAAPPNSTKRSKFVSSFFFIEVFHGLQKIEYVYNMQLKRQAYAGRAFEK